MDKYCFLHVPPSLPLWSSVCLYFMIKSEFFVYLFHIFVLHLAVIIPSTYISTQPYHSQTKLRHVNTGLAIFVIDIVIPKEGLDGTDYTREIILYSLCHT